MRKEEGKGKAEEKGEGAAGGDSSCPRGTSGSVSLYTDTHLSGQE